MSVARDRLNRIAEIFHDYVPTTIEAPTLTPASVLICLVPREDDLYILFSLRSEDLPVHSGQISFPGGAAEPGETTWETAIRETEEEVGIPRGAIEPLGRMDQIQSNSGYLISPWVGTADPEDEYVLQPTEVVEVFEAPLGWLLRPELPVLRTVRWRGIDYPVYSWVWNGNDIWGLTGLMLKMFIDRLRPDLGVG